MNRHRFLTILVCTLLGAMGFSFLLWGRGEDANEAFSPRLLIIGVDGADWQILDPLLQAGRLPNLARLRERSAYGTLMSIDPTLSPVVWTTILTGRKREHHLISGFSTGGNTSLGLTSLKTRQVPALWDICNQNGLRCGVVGPLLAWPTETVNGFFVGDMSQIEALGATSPKIQEGIYPSGLVARVVPWIRDRGQLPDSEWLPFTSYSEAPQFNPRNRRHQLKAQKIDMLKSALVKDQMTADIAVTLLTEVPVDVGFVYFRATDTVCHKYWRDREGGETGSPFAQTIDLVYEWTDRQLGRLLSLVPPETNIVIVSDHGFKGMGAGDPITDHRKEGILLWAGPGAQKGHFSEKTTILEVFPLAAYLAGLPLADELDGRFPAHLVQEQWKKSHPVLRIPAYPNPKIQAASGEIPISTPLPQVIDDLKSLGYL